MSYLLAIAVLLALLAASLGYGLTWLHVLRLAPARGIRDGLAALNAAALGMGTLAYLVLAVGLSGFLRLPVLGGLILAGWGLLAWGLVRRGSEPSEEPPVEAAIESPLERWAALLLTAFVGLLALATLCSAFLPPAGLDWDSLSYHLAAPKIYLRAGRIGFIAYDHHTQFPFTLEMLYTVGLAFQGAAAAKLVHWACAWMTAAAVGLWTARLQVRGRPVPLWTGPLAAALFGSMPVALWEAGTGYIDLGTAFFQFLALAALVDAVRTSDGQLSGVDPRRVALSAILTGFALGTKYTALIQAGLLGLGLLALLARVDRKARGPVLQGVLRFGLLAALFASPWYVKNWLWVRNPVYPFFYSLFPHSFAWTAAEAGPYAGEQAAFGLPRTPANLALVFWNLALHGREFFVNGKPPAGDVVGSIGPAWAGLLPLMLWVRGLGWRVWALCGYGLGSMLIWFFLSQQVRYLIPVFAPLAVVAAVTVAASGGALRVAGAVFSALVLAGNLWLHVPVARGGVGLVTGQFSEEDYLTAALGELYVASRWANENLPPESRIALYSEVRGYYLDRDYFWANPGHHALIPYGRLRSGRELAEQLRRFRITHVLINYSFSRDQGETEWYRLLMDGIRSGALERVYETPRAEVGRRGIVIYRLDLGAGG